MRLAHEATDETASGYDRGFYADQLFRAAESILAPVGWRQTDIEAYLADRIDASLATFN